MIAATFGMAFWFCGCYDAPEPEPGPNGIYYDVVIDRSGPTGFEARVPWTTFDDPELFGWQIPSLQALAGRLGLQLRFVAGNRMAEELAASFGEVGCPAPIWRRRPMGRSELRVRRWSFLWAATTVSAWTSVRSSVRSEDASPDRRGRCRSA